MKIDTFYPAHPLLKKYIQYYYFLKSNSSKFNAEYYAFPNTIQALNIHKNACCEINSHHVKVSGCKENNYLMLLQGKFELPLLVQLNGKLDKVTILFKAAGLNPFIKTPYQEVAGEPTQIFTEWSENKNYTLFLNAFYGEVNNKTRVQILENYLMSHYSPLKDEHILQNALILLADFDHELSIEEIAKRLSLNSRAFNRLFCKHIGISPVGFRKIARFRHSLKNRLFDTRFTTLTEIGYESNFYDQSYFIKMYKKITGDNPSGFFKSIEKLADNQLIFKFVKKQPLSEKYNFS